MAKLPARRSWILLISLAAAIMAAAWKLSPPSQAAPALVRTDTGDSRSPADRTKALSASHIENLRFEQLTVRNGLSQNAVLTIAQDQQGFMWFGTEDGLNRYDGYDFTIYKHDPEDPSSLADNFVSSLYVDRAGILWIGTRNGLDRLEPGAQEFIHYYARPGSRGGLSGAWITAILEDSRGRLFVGSVDGGLDLYDPTSDSFRRMPEYSTLQNPLAGDSINIMREGPEGTLWIGAASGLYQWDEATRNLVRFRHNPDDLTSLSSDNIQTLWIDSHGTLWAGTEAGGLNRYNAGSQTFIRYIPDPGDPFSLVHERVRVIFEDSAGRLWIGTQNGLDLWEEEGQHFIHFTHNPYDPTSLSSNAIWSIYEDRGGVLWIGTYGGGLNKHSQVTEQFGLYKHTPEQAGSLSDNMVWALYEDRDGVPWVGTFNGGLNRMDPDTGEFSVFRQDPSDPDSLSSNDVRAIVEDDQGRLWIGTSGGLDRYDRRSRRFIHYRNIPSDPTSLSENRVTTLLVDRSGSLWVGTRSGGLNLMDPETGLFRRYRYQPDDDDSLSNDRIWSLFEDSQGRLWVGTLGGANRLDPGSESFVRYYNHPQDPNSLSNDSVFSFAETPDGAIWIGTWGGGLDRLDPETGEFRHFTEKDGLPNNVIYGIEIDSFDRLWLSTNNGLSRFDPQTETFQNFDPSHGVQDYEFNVGAHYTGADGRMYFGGIAGFNAFIPDAVAGNQNLPPVLITEFRKFNRVVSTNLLPGQQLRLAYNDNFITFRFAALDYTAPERNQYAYMMEGLDTDWVYVSSNRSADFRNLNPGNYTFHVKASNSDGLWNEASAWLAITVTPPFWATWWFRTGVTLLVLGAAFGAYRWRVSSIEARSRELAVEVTARTRDLQRRTQELKALYDADEQLYRYFDLKRVAQALVDTAVENLQADKSSLVIWDESHQNLVLQAARGYKTKTLEQMVFPLDEGIIGQVATTGIPAIIEDVEETSGVTRRITDPEGIRSLMHIPLFIGDQVFGVFNVNYMSPRSFDEEEVRLFTALAQRAMLAFQNAQLYMQAQKLAALEERQRLARDLHDAVTQTLFSASLIADVLPQIWHQDPEEGRHLLDELRQLNRGALAEMRTLLLELRPAALAEASLDDLLRQLAEAAAARTETKIRVEVEGDVDLPSHITIAFYRIAQEALNNLIKHAQAGNAVMRVRFLPLDGGGTRVEMCVRDDGRGFDPENTPPDHLGMSIMRERAQDISAHLQVESVPGEGSQVSVVWDSHPAGRLPGDGASHEDPRFTILTEE